MADPVSIRSQPLSVVLDHISSVADVDFEIGEGVDLERPMTVELVSGASWANIVAAVLTSQDLRATMHEDRTILIYREAP